MSNDLPNELPNEFPDEIEDHAEPAAASSALTSLRARRTKVKDKLYFDLAVPRYDPPVFVRFAPLPAPLLTATAKRAEKSRDPEAEIKGNAALLAHVCRGVFEVRDGVEVSIDPENEEWPRFDKRLAELLDPDAAAPTSAGEVVRMLYATDGDVIATVTDLGRHSGYADEDLQRDLAGN